MSVDAIPGIVRTIQKNDSKKAGHKALLKSKKEQGTKPCSKIVSTLLPRKFGFDLD
jgi:hypothetical protein